MGITAVDLYTAVHLTRRTRKGKEPAMEVKQSITLLPSPDEVSRFWRNFENLPRFMDHLESVHVTGSTRSHWTAKAPAAGPLVPGAPPACWWPRLTVRST